MLSSLRSTPPFLNARPIAKRGERILSVVCSPVTDFVRTQSVIDELSDTLHRVKTLYDFSRGAGTSAPQIGVNSRISVIDFNGHRHVLVNPELIERSSDTIQIREGCLSFFDFRGSVERFRWVKVKAFDRNGKEYTLEGEGKLASLLQHEIDHLDGILYVDRLPNGEADLVRHENMPQIP